MDDAINTLSNLVETLDLKIVDDTLEVSEGTEQIIASVVKLKKFVELAEKTLNSQLKKIAQENPNLKAYQGDSIRLVFSSRESYSVDETVDDRFCLLERKPKKEAILKFIELKGELPKGVSINKTNTITKTLI